MPAVFLCTVIQFSYEEGDHNLVVGFQTTQVPHIIHPSCSWIDVITNRELSYDSWRRTCVDFLKHFSKTLYATYMVSLGMVLILHYRYYGSVWLQTFSEWEKFEKVATFSDGVESIFALIYDVSCRSKGGIDEVGIIIAYKSWCKPLGADRMRGMYLTQYKWVALLGLHLQLKLHLLGQHFYINWFFNFLTL